MRSYLVQSAISLYSKLPGDRIHPTFLCKHCGWSNDRWLKKSRKKPPRLSSESSRLGRRDYLDCKPLATPQRQAQRAGLGPWSFRKLTACMPELALL
jgi:hypothetical protein